MPDTVTLPPLMEDASPEVAWKYSTKSSVDAYWFAGLCTFSFVLDAEALTATFPLIQVAFPLAELDMVGSENPLELDRRFERRPGVGDAVTATTARLKSPALKEDECIVNCSLTSD